MNNTVLNLSLRKNCLNCRRKATQIVRTGDKNIFNPTVAQTVQYSCPVFCAFVFTNPHAENIFVPVQINANRDIDSLLHDVSIAAHMIVDRIQKYYRVDRLQRPLLPFLCDRQNLIRNAAYRRIRDIYAVNILDMCFDIAGCHALGIHRQNLLLDILTDTGLILFQQLRLKFTLAIPRNCYFYIAETGAKCLTAVAIAAVFGIFVAIIVPAVPQFIIQFSFQTVFHEFGNCFFEKILDVIHAGDVAHIQQLSDF